jgi:hypothetical protein
LEEGIDALDDPPRELAGFFAEVDALPYWVDPDLLDRGARVVGRTGLLGLTLVMPCASLYGGYLASRPGKTLMRTGYLDTMAARRLAEAAGWWVDVTTLGGLGRFEAGFKGILRVRLMHAQVRAAMNRRSDWDHDAWDSPVNQIQLAGTLLLFSHVMLPSSRALMDAAAPLLLTPRWKDSALARRAVRTPRPPSAHRRGSPPDPRATRRPLPRPLRRPWPFPAQSDPPMRGMFHIGRIRER